MSETIRELRKLRANVSSDAKVDIPKHTKRNMTSYEYAASSSDGQHSKADLERDNLSKWIFQALEVAFGRGYNEYGSWHPSNVEDAYSKDVTIETSPNSPRIISVSVTGQLADMEEGIPNWSWFKGLWYGNDESKGIKHIVKDENEELFKKLEKALPSAPSKVRERPYVGIAVHRVHKDVHRKIDKKLSNMRLRL